MSARDWESVMPFGELRHEMDRLLDNFVGGIGKGLPFRAHGFPPLNLWESDENLTVEAELPGIALSDVDVQVVGNELTIKGRSPEVHMTNVTYHREERHSGGFARTVKLPQEVKSENVQAVLKNGLLTITLPKSDVSRAHRVAVKGD